MKTTIIIPTLALGLLPGAIIAEEPPRPPMPKPPVIAALDADNDGVISEEEIENAAEALASLDRNDDGQLTRDELHPSPPSRPEGGGEDERHRPRHNGDQERDHHRPLPPLMQALDKNGDGKISAREMKRAKRTLSKLDQNGDDELTRDELEPPQPGRAENGGRPGPPPHDGGRPPRGGPGRR